MRFRGNLTAASFPVLMEISQYMARLSSSDACFVVVTPERMSFVMKTGGEDVQTFVHLTMAKLFEDVVLESRSENQIAFTLSIANFSRALQSGKEASGILLRLLKRDGRSFLALRARTVDIDIIQNIPIDVVSMASAENYKEPRVPSPTVAVEIPTLRSLRTVTDRLKAMHKYLTIEAKMDGSLRLRVQSDTFALQTQHVSFKPRFDLVEEASDDDAHEDIASRVSTVRVDGRHFSKMLSVDGNAVVTILCCLIDNRALVLHSILCEGFGSFTCYSPVIAPE
ncbi:hypothetical protein SPRG_02867 [Saprolegnia parasitica CBS 223.65]|uniref:Checkpoint protein n=1 Tax=Saprolegnia parasitica (strain CBS 223.65) TaxID=695850 RepID=A0A067CT11_SAPPC|nr:hypothetical protein SPRG_02867 [Saprolegnia parasitica CBS 223.65]KDO32390.1 hypothetical protein SPRG_02867 [Saprolegnia parasitica CBS 223.65]|eukprot:XP_012196844.1 hypothetical protein SPRG_02867 [Saprolegnia parasitica CBS 223.65]